MYILLFQRSVDINKKNVHHWIAGKMDFSIFLDVICYIFQNSSQKCMTDSDWSSQDTNLDIYKAKPRGFSISSALYLSHTNLESIICNALFSAKA